jgi:hypothetical protein
MLLFLLSSNPLLFTSFQGGFELLFLRVQVDQILCLWYRAVKNNITQKWKKSSTFFNFKLVQELEFPNHFKELSDPLIWQRNFNPPHVGGGASPLSGIVAVRFMVRQAHHPEPVEGSNPFYGAS